MVKNTKEAKVDIMLPAERQTEAERVMDFIDSLDNQRKENFMLILDTATMLLHLGIDKIGA